MDFISLSYCRSAEDVHECRDFLAAIGADHTKVRAAGGGAVRCKAFIPEPEAASGTAAHPPACSHGSKLPAADTPSCTQPATNLHPLPLTRSSPSVRRGGAWPHYLTTSPCTALPHPCPQVIAKCETRQSLFNFRSLVDAADAVIISRGNLGLDVVSGEGWSWKAGHLRRFWRCRRQAMISTCRPALPLDCCPAVPSALQVPEKMAMIQKAMISTCAILGKPSIITRVVDTMIRTPRPTR